MDDTAPEPLLTTAQAAALAGVDVDTIRSWRDRGHLQPAGAGLWRPADVWRCARDRRPRPETARLRLAASRWAALPRE